MTRVLLGSALHVLTAGCVVWTVLRRGRSPEASPALVACLALVLALGVAAMGELLSLLLGGGAATSAVVSIALLGASAALAWRRGLQARRKAAEMEPPPAPASALTPALGLLFGAAVLATALAAIVILRMLPHGVWDVWAVWNNRARFLYRGGAEWTVIFHPGLQHPDYPLLLALLTSAGWRLAGSDTTVVPRLLAFAFTFLSVGVVVTAIRQLRGRTQGWLAGLAALALPHFVGQGAQQGADVPFGCFVVAALACVALAEADRAGREAALALAGVFAGLAVWTKNEGLLFALSLTLAVFALGWWRRSPWAMVRGLCRGLAPFAVLLWAVRLMFVRTPAGVVESDASWLGLLQRLADPARHGVILAGLSRFLRGEWPPAESHPPLLAVALLAAYLLAAGTRGRGAGRGGSAVLFTTLGLVGVGYYLVYLVTRYDIRWFVTNSVDRLFVQYWPALVLSVFAWARTPEEVGAAAERPAGGRAPAAAA
jgi:hypothetical protein